ncbi:hypothetical protein ACH9L7_12405 [Haloferax sp. S1W]|uniref:hypothetical protein n=1 Tax=Haloferax sp. S1W TaxID=3377110 RepID=UPI0037C53265
MTKDIYIENSEGVYIEGNKSSSGQPLTIEVNNSSGVIRNQHAVLSLTEGSDFDIVDSDIEHLIVDESFVQLYDVLIKGLDLRGATDSDYRVPQYFSGNEDDSFDTRLKTTPENAAEVAAAASQAIEYLSKAKLIYWLLNQTLIST